MTKCKQINKSLTNLKQQKARKRHNLKQEFPKISREGKQFNMKIIKIQRVDLSDNYHRIDSSS